MFTFKGATISARELTIGDEEDSYALLEAAFPEGKRVVRVHTFILFLLAADIEGDFPVPMLGANAKPEAYAEAYAEWRKLPRSFPALWEKELAAAEGLPKE